MSDNFMNTAQGAQAMRIRVGAGLIAMSMMAGCDFNLDLDNPNAPTEQAALSSLEGVIATSLGMQDQFAGSVLTYVRAPALITDEWGTASRALAADQSLFTGEGIDPGFGVVSGPYSATYTVVRTADEVIGAVPELEGLGTGLSAGLLANAKLFKAMALGYAALHYERLPKEAALEGGVPVARAEVIAEVIRLLESARADLLGVSDAELATFNTRAVSTGFSVRNTIDAMLARYYLFAGQYTQAAEAASRVNLGVVSLLTYPDPELNPIWNYSTDGAGYVAPLRSWAEEAVPGDQRVRFWVDLAATPPAGNPPTLRLAEFEMYGERNDPFPVYIPGEMLLIRAEAAARAGDLAAAVALINQVRARKSTVNTPGADLPPLTTAQLNTQESVLRQIVYERKYELFSQGLRWEDLRRFPVTLTGEALEVQFLPFPEAECNSNPNAAC